MQKGPTGGPCGPARGRGEGRRRPGGPGAWVLIALAAVLVVSCSTGPGASGSGGVSGSAPRSNPVVSPGADAVTLEQTFVQVVKAVGPSVVQITTPSGLGSGVVFDAKGDIVTNAHVVGNATTFRVTTSAGKQYEGTLVGSFPPDDLAVIHVDAGLPPASFADSSQVQIGDIVLAMGSPLGLQGTVTEGIVSAVGRQVQESPQVTLPDTIQTSAAINPGNSGGALVNLRGQVIGIPTLAASSPAQEGGAGQAPGIGFAISSNRVKDIAGQIVQHGHVVNSHRAYLGVVVASTLNGNVAVVQVVGGGPAARAGIQPGDLIVSVNGKQVPDTATLASVLAQLSPGQTVPVQIVKPNGSKPTVTVTLGQIPGTG
jgi:putative serine protease PepD